MTTNGRPGGMSTLARQEERWAYLFLSPSIAGLLFFTVGPVIESFLISLSQYDVMKPPTFIGIQNYVQLFTADKVFLDALRNTFYYTFVATPLGIVLSLLLALAMNQKIKGIVVLRAIYFVPVITSSVAISLLWSWIYNPNFGILNWLLSFAGIQGPEWLASDTWAMPAIIIMAVWQGLGYEMTIFLAGLQGIDTVFYEAAKIDGADAWQRFLHITVPLISPTTFFLLVITIIGGFQVFVPMYIMTQGGPNYSTISIVEHLFNNGFTYLHMGLASAMAYVLFAIVFVFTLIQLRLQDRWVHYE